MGLEFLICQRRSGAPNRLGPQAYGYSGRRNNAADEATSRVRLQRRLQSLAATTSCSRAKRLTEATSVAASRSSLPSSASTRAMISFATAAADFVGAVSDIETWLIRAS